VQTVAAWHREENLQSTEQTTDKVIRAVAAPGRGRDAGAFGTRRRDRDDQCVL